MPRDIVLVSDEQTSVCDTNVKSDGDRERTGDDKLEQTLNDNDSVSSVPLNDEDDVPSDFFDDFSNQDFMAGLDIVDAWDDEEEDLKKKPNDDPIKEVDRDRNEKSKRRRSRSPIRFNRYDRRNRRSRDRSRGSRDRDRRHRRKSKEGRVKEREGDEHKSDQRRDPEKTKRDIQKDKDKCAKDKEAQIISEKLKVVETGLVPPGMEMEVDLKEIKSVVREQNKKSEIEIGEEKKKEKGNSTREELREERKNYREEKFSVREERYERRRKSRSVSIEFHRSRYTSRNSRGQETNYEKRLNRSPYRRRTRSRSRSPYHRRISSERRFQLEERKRTNRYRDASPLVIRRTSRGRSYNRSRSRNRSRSNVSEREMWLRKRDYKRDQKPSSSPVGEIDFKKYKRNKESFMEELVHILDSEKKKKFLKEIQERINEPVRPGLSPHFPMVSTPLPVPAPVSNSGTGLPPNSMHCPPPQPVPVPVPVPVPGPAPGPGPGYMPNQSQFSFPPPVEPSVQYDQQFFIGQPDMFHNNDPYGHPSNVTDTIPTSMFSPTPIESPIPINFSQLHNNVDILRNQQTAEAQKYHQEAVAKLFEDKKISLSDFLSISAKPADTTQPINVQKKNKSNITVSRCD
ncbi:hypothetical protein ILUMI_08877 [Ignelater luminosus]|uniref:Uncharacterized protein n=1 Tax=Ignelater luminosus TaxID=2038154 RepID=A0A8K0GGL4_IGNLU|nr:hypothetical protein ILUMI_08877 [Ignelater luminosus]